MKRDLVTTNISLPREDWKALKVLAAQHESSMANLIRESIGQFIRKRAKNLIRRRRLTVNGFTPEFEEEVLKAAAEPVDESRVMETDEDFERFYESLRSRVARQKR